MSLQRSSQDTQNHRYELLTPTQVLLKDHNFDYNKNKPPRQMIEKRKEKNGLDPFTAINDMDTDAIKTSTVLKVKNIGSINRKISFFFNSFLAIGRTNFITKNESIIYQYNK